MIAGRADYFGTPVNRAARFWSGCNAGQVRLKHPFPFPLPFLLPPALSPALPLRSNPAILTDSLYHLPFEPKVLQPADLII